MEKATRVKIKSKTETLCLSSYPRNKHCVELQTPISMWNEIIFQPCSNKQWNSLLTQQWKTVWSLCYICSYGLTNKLFDYTFSK